MIIVMRRITGEYLEVPCGRYGLCPPCLFCCVLMGISGSIPSGSIFSDYSSEEDSEEEGESEEEEGGSGEG